MKPEIVMEFIGSYERISKTESELNILYKSPLTLDERKQCENLFSKIDEMKKTIKNTLPFPIE